MEKKIEFELPWREIIEYILVEEIDPNFELNISYKHLDRNIEMKNRWKI